MTIKQQGGVFGRNPTFNNVAIDGTLTVDQIFENAAGSGVTLDGVTLKDGNVFLSDGKGVDFSATSGTGTSELFDDYEEGTWTAALANGGAVAEGGGAYRKIGKFVFVDGNIILGSVTDASVCTITGLPYAGSGRSGGFVTYTNYGSAPVISVSGATVVLRDASGSLISYTAMSGKRLDFCLSIRVA